MAIANNARNVSYGKPKYGGVAYRAPIGTPLPTTPDEPLDSAFENVGYLNQDGISYVGTQYAEWQDMMRRVDAGLDPTDTSAEIPEPQASDTELGAATNAASPAEYHDLMADALTTDDVVDVE